jgi:hypothetical protein
MRALIVNRLKKENMRPIPTRSDMGGQYRGSVLISGQRFMAVRPLFGRSDSPQSRVMLKLNFRLTTTR